MAIPVPRDPTGASTVELYRRLGQLLRDLFHILRDLFAAGNGPPSGAVHFHHQPPPPNSPQGPNPATNNPSSGPFVQYVNNSQSEQHNNASTSSSWSHSNMSSKLTSSVSTGVYWYHVGCELRKLADSFQYTCRITREQPAGSLPV